MSQYPYKRSILNYLLQPMLQLRPSLATICLAVAGFVVIGVYVYTRMVDFAEVVATLTESDAAIRELMSEYLQSTGLVAVAIMSFVLFTNILFTIFFTHKMVGPTIAFRRHIKSLQDGQYQKRVKLRKGDAFTEVASELNTLAEVLENRHGASDGEKKAV